MVAALVLREVNLLEEYIRGLLEGVHLAENAISRSLRTCESSGKCLRSFSIESHLCVIVLRSLCNHYILVENG